MVRYGHLNLSHVTTADLQIGRGTQKKSRNGCDDYDKSEVLYCRRSQDPRAVRDLQNRKGDWDSSLSNMQEVLSLIPISREKPGMVTPT